MQNGGKTFCGIPEHYKRYLQESLLVTVNVKVKVDFMCEVRLKYF